MKKKGIVRSSKRRRLVKRGQRIRASKAWQFLIWVFSIPVLVIVLMIIIVCNDKENEGISRAQASKAAALAMASRKECEELEKGLMRSHFSEGSRSAWYVKYMDYLYENGYLIEEITPPDTKEAQGYFTYEEAEHLAEAVSEDLKKKIHVTNRNRKKPISIDEWWMLYEAILDEIQGENRVEEKELVIYGTPLNMKTAPAWAAYTNEGTIGFEGLALDRYIDCRISCLVRDGELVRIKGLISEQVVYENVWMEKAEGKDSDCLVYVGNITKELHTGLDENELQEMYSNIVDITLDKGKVKKIVVKKDRVSGRVLAVKENGIEIEGRGWLPLSSKFQVFKVYNGFERKRLSDILVGYDIQEFVLSEGKIDAVLIVRAFDLRNIRVLITDMNTQSEFHQSLTFTSQGAMEILWGDGKEERLEPGVSVTLTGEDTRLELGRVLIRPEDGQEIIVQELKKGHGIPSYGGHLEVAREDGNSLSLVNEVYVEDYLKRVVPSEMIPSYEMEALKAQAVCARTFAYEQIQANRYSQYGAHVDDSNNSQVYNNAEQNPNTDRAVEETQGEILTYYGEPITAFYFSTSCGTTTDGALWGGNAEDFPYLKSVSLQDDRKVFSLQDNYFFSQFIKNKEIPSYDSGFPFYRWEMTTTNRILEEKITGIGNITGMQVTERGAGGIVKELEITGTVGKKSIRGHGQICSLLGNDAVELIRKDGKKVRWDVLPSAFFAVEGNGKTFHIYGGGFGHGLGMSQNGAQGMAKTGHTYREILEFFYDGAEITEILWGE
ncbi:SpoIID/LytB domain-containing protein [Lachnospiraceae bacterium 62-35]